MSAVLSQDEFWSRKPERPVHVLFVGPALAGAKDVFKRKDEYVRCDHTSAPSTALDMIVEQAKIRRFDCVMIDMRRQADGNPLNIFAIAALKAFGTLTILARPEDVPTFEVIVGVDSVLPDPVNPKDIVRTIVESAAAGDPELIAIPKVNSAAELEDQLASQDEDGDDTDATDTDPIVDVEATRPDAVRTVTRGFEASLTKIREADGHVWQRFVPFASFVYKKLAIIVLTALFLTFFAYGAMIVFFMSSSSWSLPFELSRGHALVEKVERDLSSLRLRRNQVRQDLTSANVEVSKAMRDQRDGELQLTLTKRTVEEEISLQTQQELEITEHIERLRQVINDFNSLNGKGGFVKDLQSAYSQRLITRKALNSGTLAVLETLHRVAIVQNEISLKQLELDKVGRRLEFLNSLLEEIKQPQVRVITSAGSDLAHLAREVILAKNQISLSERAAEAAQKRVDRLNNSLEVVSANISSLEATPMARALDKPVMVLFVPYTNSSKVKQGEPLYACALSFFLCSQVGEVGPSVDGETTSVHPLFGKPMRGTFVEAEFYDPRSVTKEIVHAGGAPLLF